MHHDKATSGHLYAIEFSSGTVKVGRSRDLIRRIDTHLAAATVHGATADRIWISEPVDRLDEREKELLAFCAARWKLAAGSEYFCDADIAAIIKQANSSGAGTRELQGRPLTWSPLAGTSYMRAFKALPAEAAEVRAWARSRVPHANAPQVVSELFTAIHQSGADVVEVTLSTAGDRLKLTTTGPELLSLRHSHGPGWRIVAGLSQTSGVTPDGRGLWAILEAR